MSAPADDAAASAAPGSEPAPLGAAVIEAELRAALAPTSIRVTDDSHLHAGHSGAREGRHFSVSLVSARFEGLGRVARHRLVYDALGSLMARGVHALAIDARAPGDA